MNMTLVLLGLACGVVLTGGAFIALMRRQMIQVHRSPHSFEDTVSRLEQAIGQSGWVLSDSKRLNDSFEKNNVFFAPKVHLVKLCEPRHATEVLQDSRHIACLMPCTFAVYEDDSGQVWVSKMNTRLMGKVFGGTVARVMGGTVADTEEAMLQAALKG